MSSPIVRSTWLYLQHLIFTISALTVNDDQQDATILAYLFIPNQLYMFRAISSPIVRSTWLYLQHLIFTISVRIVNDDQQDATILPYLFIPHQLYMFRTMSSPIIRSTLTVFTQSHEWDGTEFHLIRDTIRQQYRWSISEAVNTSALDDGRRHRPKHVELTRNK